MKLVLRRFPVFIVKPIPSTKENGQFFLLPGLLVGKGYFTLFWIRTMLTVNFNTTLIKEDD
jgi:hypothetical protein